MRRRAALARQRIQEEELANIAAQRALQRRLVAYRKRQARERVRERANTASAATAATAERDRISTQQSQRNRENQRLLRRVALARQRVKEEELANIVAQRDLQRRLVAYRKRQARERANQRSNTANAATSERDRVRTEDTQRNRVNQRLQRRAALARQRVQEEELANIAAQRALQRRLVAYRERQPRERQPRERQPRERQPRERAASAVAERERIRKLRDRGIDRSGARRLHSRGQQSREYIDSEARGTQRVRRQEMDAAAASGQINQLRRLQEELRRTSRETRRLNIAQRGLVDSTRNMIRSYASVFAIFQGTAAIKRVGQDFQGMEAAMLASSGSAVAAAKDMKFLDGMVDEMGLNLKSTTDAFVKFKFASKGKFDDETTEDIFKSASMFGTALKINSEDMKRAMKALTQMMSKGKITAEELRQQLGDSMPGAIQIFAKALDLSSAELDKQMSLGKIISSETLPLVAKELRKAAMAAGAYDKALKGLVVTEGRMITESQRAGKKIFESGFSEGLAKLFDTISKVLKNSGPQLEKLGRVFGQVFKALAHALRLLEPIMKIFIDNFEIMFGVAALKTLAVFATAVNISLAKAFLPITLAVLAVEELITLMSDDLIGVTEDLMGKQFNILTRESSPFTKKDGKYIRGETKEKVKDKTGEGFSSAMADTPFFLRPTTAAFYGLSAFNNLVPFFGNSPTSTVQNNNGNSGTVNVEINGVTDDKMAGAIDKQIRHLVQGGMAPNGA